PIPSLLTLLGSCSDTSSKTHREIKSTTPNIRLRQASVRQDNGGWVPGAAGPCGRVGRARTRDSDCVKHVGWPFASAQTRKDTRRGCLSCEPSPRSRLPQSGSHPLTLHGLHDHHGEKQTPTLASRLHCIGAMTELQRDPAAFAIIAAAMEVHRNL